MSICRCCDPTSAIAGARHATSTTPIVMDDVVTASLAELERNELVRSLQDLVAFLTELHARTLFGRLPSLDFHGTRFH
jgi:hypothetical protein